MSGQLFVYHHNPRDGSPVFISRAPHARLAAFRERMGWRFKWVSSAGCDFNRDFHVSFTDEELGTEVDHNFARINGAYHVLDMVPRGRGEDDLEYSMSWLRLHDSYE